MAADGGVRRRPHHRRHQLPLCFHADGHALAHGAAVHAVLSRRVGSVRVRHRLVSGCGARAACYRAAQDGALRIHLGAQNPGRDLCPVARGRSVHRPRFWRRLRLPCRATRRRGQRLRRTHYVRRQFALRAARCGGTSLRGDSDDGRACCDHVRDHGRRDGAHADYDHGACCKVGRVRAVQGRHLRGTDQTPRVPVSRPKARLRIPRHDLVCHAAGHRDGVPRRARQHGGLAGGLPHADAVQRVPGALCRALDRGLRVAKRSRVRDLARSHLRRPAHPVHSLGAHRPELCFVRRRAPVHGSHSHIDCAHNAVRHGHGHLPQDRSPLHDRHAAWACRRHRHTQRCALVHLSRGAEEPRELKGRLPRGARR
eukprot:Amastigsp_a174350_266.p3 type:complete len:369 gc:universal Amastigsp_a174350_266:1153-47(-)